MPSANAPPVVEGVAVGVPETADIVPTPNVDCILPVPFTSSLYPASVPPVFIPILPFD